MDLFPPHKGIALVRQTPAEAKVRRAVERRQNEAADCESGREGSYEIVTDPQTAISATAGCDMNVQETSSKLLAARSTTLGTAPTSNTLWSRVICARLYLPSAPKYCFGWYKIIKLQLNTTNTPYPRCYIPDVSLYESNPFSR